MSTVYSIKDLEKLCGVKAHTLRIWEKRYGIIKPHRNAKNIRYFLDADIKKVLNIALLNRNGIKISKIAKMEENEISDKVENLTSNQSSLVDRVDAMTLGILELDLIKCEAILQNDIENNGLEESMYRFIYPLLDKLSMMWISGSLKGVHESFIRNLIKVKVSAEINNIASPSGENHKKFLIFLPENEQHELSLLFLHYILKKNNAKVIDLGTNTSVHDIIQGCEIYRPDFTFTIINDGFVKESLQSYIDFLASHIPNAKLLFSGFQFVRQNISLPSNCKIIGNLKGVENYL